MQKEKTMNDSKSMTWHLIEFLHVALMLYWKKTVKSNDKAIYYSLFNLTWFKCYAFEINLFKIAHQLIVKYNEMN